MKKWTAFWIIAALSLTLMGCGQSTHDAPAATEPPAAKESTPAPTEDPSEAVYEAALEALAQEDWGTAYGLFAQAGNYEDAAEYLGRFTVVEDVLLMRQVAYQLSGGSGTTVYHYTPDGLLAYVENAGPVGYEMSWEPENISGSRVEYAYSQGGLLEKVSAYNIRFNQITQEPEELLVEERAYTYDDAGRLAEVENSYGSGFETSVETGRTEPTRIEKTWYNMFYDAEGRLERVLKRVDHNSMEIQMKFTYDEAGNLVNVSSGSDNYDYIYDESGYLIETSSDDGLTRVCTFAYDTQGRLATATCDYPDEDNIDPRQFTYKYGTYYQYNAE